MNGIIKNVGANLTRFGSKMLFKAKKSSPELLIAGGAALLIVSTVMACKATKKAEEAIEDCEAKVNMINKESEEMTISDNDRKNYIRQAKVKMIGQMLQIYAVPAAIGAVGFTLIFTSHGIMKKRNGALIAAYNALDAAFQKYRERVKASENGAELDRQYMYGDDYPREADDGLDRNAIYDVNKEGLKLAHGNPYGPYGFEFSKYTTNKWMPHSQSNLNTIRSAEEWGDRQLRFFGHLFLNDMLKYLGLDEVPWGQLVGWIRGEKDGDGKVIILATEDQEALEMDTEGWKRPILLDFNCDGVIWDRI